LTIKSHPAAAGDHAPVQPGQQALGGGDEVDHGGQQVVGEPPRGPALRLAAAAPAGYEVLQVFGRGAELVGQSPDALRLQARVLTTGNITKSTCRPAPGGNINDF